MKKIILVLSVAITAYGLSSCNNAENAENKAVEERNEEVFDRKLEKDAEFAATAASGSLMEIELGHLASSNGSSALVKEFGQNMITDHTKASEELKAAANAKNIALPAIPDNDMQKEIDDLKQKTGAEFDKEYIDLMVKDHKNDIDLFKDEAEKGNDPELKAWAASKVAVLEHQLQMAENIQEELKKNK